MKKRTQHRPYDRKPKSRPKVDITRRGSPYERGYDLIWRRFAKWYLLNNPWCAVEGCESPANEVDHITPMEDGGEKYNLENLQALCKSCHSRKTVDDMRKRQQAKSKKDSGVKAELMGEAVKAANELRKRVGDIFSGV